jgi:hypothetical protein
VDGYGAIFFEIIDAVCVYSMQVIIWRNDDLKCILQICHERVYGFGRLSSEENVWKAEK